MNVCMISYSVYESDGRVMRYAETLARRGDRVDVISLSRAERTSDDVIAGVNVSRVQGRTHDEKGPFSYLVRVLSFFYPRHVAFDAQTVSSKVRPGACALRARFYGFHCLAAEVARRQDHPGYS